MLRMNRQGFTLIELMVVIVIIGVLASLAIPKFTEASAKAKMAEAPRIMASYESAYGAALAELGTVNGGREALIFTIPNDSKWFDYAALKTPTEDAEDEGDPRIFKATARNDMGVFKKDGALWTGHMSGGSFKKAVTGAGDFTDALALKAANKLVPNFPAADSDINYQGCPAGEVWGIKAAGTNGGKDVYDCITAE